MKKNKKEKISVLEASEIMKRNRDTATRKFMDAQKPKKVPAVDPAIEKKLPDL
jgi:hypothetical protein